MIKADKSRIISKKYILVQGSHLRFILNATWEFAQAGPLNNMWAEVSLASGLFHITLAIIGDAIVLIAITLLAVWICGHTAVHSLSVKVGLYMLVIGGMAGLLLEWMAKALNW